MHGGYAGYAGGASAFDEDSYEQTIIDRMVNRLGYEHLYGPDVERSDGRYHDVFLSGVLRKSLCRINPGLPGQAIDEAILKLEDVEGGSLAQRNERFTDYLQSGVEVRYFDGREERNELVRLVDYDEPERNAFHVVNQWTYVEHENKRPDVVVFVNGMPLVVFELKSPSREDTSVSDAYAQLRNYLKAIPSFFVPNAFLVISDSTETRVGTITSPEDRFSEWKSVDGDYAKNDIRWQTMIDGMFRKDRLVDILRNFICFNDDGDKVVKILAAYHQYFGVHKAADRAVEAVAGDGRIGVFWHTQGSGKSLSMVFLAHLLQTRIESPTIVVVTDRNDLDGQLFGQFSRCSKFLRQQSVQAKSREDLRKLLSGREANGIVFTTMQKFIEGDGPLCDRSNVIVMIDEAHRGQYGLTETIKEDGTVSIGAAKQMRDALPNASYIGFTGTPIELDGRNTQEVFGGYIDVYDMTQSVEDNATVPVYYESRVVALHLDQGALDELDAAYGEYAASHDEATTERSKHSMAALDAILGAPETIDSLCEDMIAHYEQNRADLLTGKAMIVAYSRPTAMKIYYRLLELRPEWKDKVGVVMTTSNQDPEEWYEVTHGVTPGQGKSGLGRLNHNKDMERRFKSDDDPLRIVIVVDMWLTGFDVPSLATMYMYKPMRGHNLMQAIARVNRVYLGKEGGLIVDYIGIAGALKAAMHDYTQRDRKQFGDMDIAKTAYPKFREKLAVCRDLLHGFDYRGRITTQNKEELAACIADGTDWLLDKDRIETRDEFLKQSQLLESAESLCKSMVSEADQYEAAFIHVLRVQVLRILGKAPSTGHGMSYAEFNRRISSMLEQTVQSDGVINLIGKDSTEISLFNESVLDEISKMKVKNIALETLKRLISEQVKAYRKTSVVKSQKFSEMLQTTLNAYLNGMLTNAEVIEELMAMAKDMMKDREEGKSLGLSAEELAFYDALTKPQAVKDLYTNDQLVAMTHELTDALRRNATIDWQEKRTARAGMKRAIKRLLKKYKYPPDEEPEAIETVMDQCELWADNQVL